MSATTERIAWMSADHYRDSADFEREQVEHVAAVLQEIIDIVGFKPTPPYDPPLFKSIYSVPRLLAHVRAAMEVR